MYIGLVYHTFNVGVADHRRAQTSLVDTGPPRDQGNGIEKNVGAVSIESWGLDSGRSSKGVDNVQVPEYRATGLLRVERNHTIGGTGGNDDLVIGIVAGSRTSNGHRLSALDDDALAVCAGLDAHRGNATVLCC